ncbi:hypothetical protein VRU48_10405 [Pedobacter sp. KR3-3]|uniref:YD repeat-containing protein n=1 Tax=Pedobacter albus TaxID=3113905 RepID=A0ABU7I7T2_9SPHI|nr:hypothetical protein [Pedobacter sp. KR3-3]MEE1945522.1 hypothetical protein [Pedobacter sp. KR3-3]
MRLLYIKLLPFLLLLTLISCSKKDPKPEQQGDQKLTKIVNVDLTTGAETALWEFTYNQNSQISTIVGGDGRFVLTYDANGKLSGIAKAYNFDNLTSISSFEYDGKGRPVKQTEVMKYPNSPNVVTTINTFEYDSNNRRTKWVRNSRTYEGVWSGDNMTEWNITENGLRTYSYKNPLYDNKRNPLYDRADVLEIIGFVWAKCKNNSLGETTINPDGSTSTSTIDRTYNALGYPTTATFSTAGKVTSKVKYYYEP